MKERVDMLMDCYGKNKENNIAVALDIPSSENIPGKPSVESRNLFQNFQKEDKVENLDEFYNFIDKYNIKFYFWRRYDANLEDHAKVYNSCVPNGACGFQLDYLLRERTQHNQSCGAERDIYIYDKSYHITKTALMNDFFNYLNTVLYTP